jgi:hypothetical protein
LLVNASLVCFRGVRKGSLDSELVVEVEVEDEDVESTGLVGDLDFKLCFCKNLGSFEDKLGLVDAIDGLEWSRRLFDIVVDGETPESESSATLGKACVWLVPVWRVFFFFFFLGGFHPPP